jgi:hypothetical protein
MDVCDSATPRLGRRRRRIRLTIEQDLTPIVRVKPGQNIEKGALSGAVLADQRMNLAGADLEINAVERDRGAEALPNSRELQERHPSLQILVERRVQKLL